MKKGADSTGKVMHMWKSGWWLVMRKIQMVELGWQETRSELCYLCITLPASDQVTKAHFSSPNRIWLVYEATPPISSYGVNLYIVVYQYLPVSNTASFKMVEDMPSSNSTQINFIYNIAAQRLD